MTTNTKTFQFMALGVVALMLQACATPELVIKKEDTHLPAGYKAGDSEQTNTASIKWKDFFDDPDLLSLIDIAVVNNKEINIMMQRISVAQNEIQARRGEYLPFVNIGAGVGGDKKGQFTRNGAVEENLPIAHGRAFPRYLGDYHFGLFSTWEIDVWKKLRNAKQIAVLEYMASKEGKNFLVTNLVAEVAHSYYELLALDNQLKNLEQNISIQQNGLEMVKQLLFYARTTALAVRRYEAEVAKNKSKVYELKQHIVVVENRINFLLGRTSQPIQRVSSGFMEFEPKVLKTGIPSQLLQNRPDIRQAELELSAAALNIKVAKANFYPSFSINAGIGFEAFALKYLINTPESLAATVAGELVAPLINKNAIIAQYKNANARQIQAAYEYEQSIIKAYTEVVNQISNIDNLDKNYQLKSSQVEALARSIDVANQLFKSARVDYLDVLLAQRDTLDAKKDLIETKQKQIDAMVDLYKSLGGGWE
ncbi:TolC family protein [Candidatus Nitrotoga sp. HW29]|uniref:TolC family protein n=1 Tax=Candidatus Nitrotoga sp. HW29 TaxID=2886963 RepID=UPI001EF293B0|nr:TolC family protein [Candidatus Nitrotoga sp. HW29]